MRGGAMALGCMCRPPAIFIYILMKMPTILKIKEIRNTIFDQVIYKALYKRTCISILSFHYHF